MRRIRNKSMINAVSITMASSLSSVCNKSINSISWPPPFCCSTIPPCRNKVLKYPIVRSQSFRDEGKPANMVDANLSVLREKIEEVRKKERLGACCRVQNGWNYKYGDDHKHKRCAVLSESIGLVGLVSIALWFVFVSGSFCIFPVFLIVHLSK